MNEENDDIKIFTDFANRFNNKIEDSNTAETFFKDFLNKTKGWVNIDCLDADNDDRIECVDFDHDKGMMRLCTRVPENAPEMASSSFLIRFKNIHFIRNKNKECIAIVVNGYTMDKKMIKSFVEADGYTIIDKSYDEKSSFFTSNLVRTKNELYEYIRAMKTPITSFWIIPKKLYISAYDSKKYLYLYNNEVVLHERLKNCLNKLSNQIGKTKDKKEIDDFIKMYGNQIRTVAEAFFKLVTCFYHDNLKNKNTDYNNLMLGDLISPLKQNVYMNTDDKSRLNTIVRIANELSHDTGLPIKFEDIEELYNTLIYYISDFKQKILSNVNIPNIPTKPSPKDYINQNLKKWNFKDTITQTVNNTSSCSCTYRLRIKDTDFKIIEDTEDFFNKNADYLCTDGYIKALKETDMSEALEVNSKENVIALIEAINNKVKSDCEAKGLDTELAYLSWDIDIIRKSKPSHLFTFDEINNLMANADDSKNNKLVIDENGCAHIITIPGPTYLYPVSIETWCAGNGYVGQNSSLSYAEPAYHLCLSLWLDYLNTNEKQYDDWYKQIDVDKTIEKIKEHY